MKTSIKLPNEPVLGLYDPFTPRHSKTTFTQSTRKRSYLQELLHGNLIMTMHK